jgi:adenylosuccinate lyase
MRKNLMQNGGIIIAEAVMLLLARKSREKVWAHQICHDIAMNVPLSGKDFLAVVTEDPDVQRYHTADEIHAMTGPACYISTAISQVEETARNTKATRRIAERTLRKILNAGST